MGAQRLDPVVAARRVAGPPGPLTVDNVASYLLDLGLLSSHAIIEGDLEIVSRTRRNRNLAITLRDQPGFLVKQPEKQDSPAAATLRREAAFYGWCRDCAGADVRSMVPRCVHAEPDSGVLILELLEDMVPLWDHYRSLQGKAFPSRTGRALGRALALLHGIDVGGSSAGPAAREFLEPSKPEVFGWVTPRPGALATLSAGGHEVLRIVQEQGMAPAIAEMSGRWVASTLVHGDLKLDNVLIVDEEGECRVALVDWELVHLGDPAWDAASALHDYVMWWIITTPPSASVEERASGATSPMRMMQPAIRGAWDAYRRESGFSNTEARAFLDRAVRYSAARIVQTAFELAGNMAALPAPAVLGLQVAANILADPARARADLYGLEDVSQR